MNRQRRKGLTASWILAQRRALVVLLTGACGTLGFVYAPPAGAVPAPEATKKTSGDPAEVAIGQALDAKKPGTAVFVCELRLEKYRLAKEAVPVTIRTLCAQAFLALGNTLETAGATGQARSRWKVALGLNPGLLDEPEFLKRFTASAGVKAPPSPALQATPGKAPRPAFKPIPAIRIPASAPKKKVPAPAALERAEEPPSGPPGPRDGRVFCLGVGAGFDGLVSLSVGWMYREVFSVEASFGILFRSFDTRVRYFGLREDLSPVVGFGMTTTMGSDARFGVALPMYEDLYRLGQTVHFDIGLSYKAGMSETFAGVVFITTLDQEHPDRLLFFPQFGVQSQLWF